MRISTALSMKPAVRINGDRMLIIFVGSIEKLSPSHLASKVKAAIATTANPLSMIRGRFDFQSISFPPNLQKFE
jgi:hypothetical protein